MLNRHLLMILDWKDGLLKFMKCMIMLYKDMSVHMAERPTDTIKP